jgi:hypothetical protein
MLRSVKTPTAAGEKFKNNVIGKKSGTVNQEAV